jgi:hypothetical protein
MKAFLRHNGPLKRYVIRLLIKEEEKKHNCVLKNLY